VLRLLVTLGDQLINQIVQLVFDRRFAARPEFDELQSTSCDEVLPKLGVANAEASLSFLWAHEFATASPLTFFLFSFFPLTLAA
jgi:hypothetical protein